MSALAQPGIGQRAGGTFGMQLRDGLVGRLARRMLECADDAGFGWTGIHESILLEALPICRSRSGQSRGRVCGGARDAAPSASLRVPSGARTRGPSRTLALPTVAPLEQSRRVRSRSALRARPRLLRSSAPHKSRHRTPAHGFAGWPRHSVGVPRWYPQGCGWAGQCAHGRRRAAQPAKGHRDAAPTAARRRGCRAPSASATADRCRPREGEVRSRPWRASSAGDLGAPGRAPAVERARPAHPRPCSLDSR